VLDGEMLARSCGSPNRLAFLLESLEDLQRSVAMVGRVTLTGAARSIFFRNLKCFGLDKGFHRDVRQPAYMANALKRRIVKVQVEVKQSKEEDRNPFPIRGDQPSVGSAR
jgi:hypothetical protein